MHPAAATTFEAVGKFQLDGSLFFVGAASCRSHKNEVFNPQCVYFLCCLNVISDALRPEDLPHFSPFVTQIAMICHRTVTECE